MESFTRYGDVEPASPVVLSVPHAGREYPDALLAMLRGPRSALLALEDRCVDLVATAARQSETLFVARRARAWIDLNRGEDDRDPRVEAGAPPPGTVSARARGGLGLVPRRAAGSAELWRRRLAPDEVIARIRADHRPYHAALAVALAAARARFGIAVLLDIHSMPPLHPRGPLVVLGDRHGASAAPALTTALERVAGTHGYTHTRNEPYAGGHVLERHGDPAAGIHALQFEIDRTAYLDAAGIAPGAGFAAVVAMVRDMIDALADAALPRPIAAE